MSAQDTLPPAGAPHSGRQLLDAIIDPSLTGSQYVEQIAKLNIHIPATRSWKDEKKWPHKSIPREILQYSPDVTGPMCIRVGLFGELEMQRFWNDLNAIVEIIWGSWDNMHAARHTRQWDVKEMREALLGQLWSLWKEPAGFPNALVIMKWFRGFVAYRVKKSRRSRKRQRNTSPKPVKISKRAVPRVSIRAPDALPRLHIPMIQAPKGLSNAHAPTRFHSPQALDPSGPDRASSLRSWFRFGGRIDGKLETIECMHRSDGRFRGLV